MNVTEYAPRRVPAVLLARTREEVESIVAIANVYLAALYPFSTGHNWGMGSKLPPRDGCVLLDLRQMNRVIEIDESHEYALIEPGVTQKRLHDELAARGSALMFNVTGSGEGTSIVGNLLERGVGMLGQRMQDIRGLEIVTGGGRVVRTGSWHGVAEGQRYAHHYPSGIGPDLTGLFQQSNFGIVTAAVLGLYPQQPATVALLRTPVGRLAAHVDALAKMRRLGLLRDRIEIDGEDDPRLHGVVRAGSEPAWWTWVALWGDSDLRNLLRTKVTAALGAICDEITFFEAASEVPEPARVRFQRLAGEPGNHSIEALARATGVVPAFDIDHDPAVPGFVCALPAVPFHGAEVVRVLELVEEAATVTKVQAFVSFNSVSAHAFEGYVRVAFDRRDRDAISRAHRWAEVVHERLVRAGYHPMRLPVVQMPSDGSGAFWKTVASLKSALDPNGIIAPGRYCP